ncbi:hypothetical protein ACFOWA_19650 [Pedobacter lithocola]|uniref:Carrier domain-containing protein n=1 Tax=Pedobacter lithocola TaxID=1908239 RepID=A0ABV8PGE5_9SPHI
METLTIEAVEKTMVDTIQEIADDLGIDMNVEINSRPGSAGISSHILVSVMAKLESILDVKIPDNCYIFHDKITLQQLSVREATQKLLKVIKRKK